MRDLLEVDLLDDIYLKNNLLSWFPKGPGEGDVWKVPLRIAGTTQHGADDVNGIAGVSGVRPVFNNFIINWMPTYGFAEVPMTSIALSQNKDTGAVPLLVDAVRDARKSCARDVELALAGDGYGTRGVIKSNTNPSGVIYVLTLTNISDAMPINIGDSLVSNASTTTTSLDTGSFTVTGVDRDAGTITGNAIGGWTPTNTHNLYLSLDKLTSVGIGNPSKFFGLSGFLPTNSTARTATFANVDRSQDPQNLAGCYLTASSTAIRAGINAMIAKILPKQDANPSQLFMSANTMMALMNELNNSVRYTEVEVEGTVNFEGIQFSTTMGKAKASFAIGIPDNLIYVLTRDSWLYGSPISGDVVQSATNFGKDYVDSYNKVAAQVRQWSFGALRCNAPGLNGVILLT
jgi:hypothetical protein